MRVCTNPANCLGFSLLRILPELSQTTRQFKSMDNWRRQKLRAARINKNARSQSGNRPQGLMSAAVILEDAVVSGKE